MLFQNFTLHSKVDENKLISIFYILQSYPLFHMNQLLIRCSTNILFIWLSFDEGSWVAIMKGLISIPSLQIPQYVNTRLKVTKDPKFPSKTYCNIISLYQRYYATFCMHTDTNKDKQILLRFSQRFSFFPEHSCILYASLWSPYFLNISMLQFTAKSLLQHPLLPGVSEKIRQTDKLKWI